MSAEESGLEQIDEDEWTDRNFGNSTANDMNTSEDSVSDLESDGEDCEVVVGDVRDAGDSRELSVAGGPRCRETAHCRRDQEAAERVASAIQRSEIKSLDSFYYVNTQLSIRYCSLNIF